MFVRSPRRFATLACIAFVFIFAILLQNPWAHGKAYERISLFDDEGRPPDELPTTLHTQDQALLEDAWQHAVPMPRPDRPAAHRPEDVALPPPTMKPKPVAEPTKIQPPWVTAPSRIVPNMLPTPRPSNLKDYMKKMLKWPRPSWDGHWPAFQDYIDKAYDPNRWEQFDMEVTTILFEIMPITNDQQRLSCVRSRTSPLE